MTSSICGQRQSIASDGYPLGSGLQILRTKLREASLAVTVPRDPEHSLFQLMYWSRWLADLKLVECALVLPLQEREAQWLRDYRSVLITALSAGSARDAAAARRFLSRTVIGRQRPLPDVGRYHIADGVPGEELPEFASVRALFRSVGAARSLAEALGFTIEMVALPHQGRQA